MAGAASPPIGPRAQKGSLCVRPRAAHSGRREKPPHKALMRSRPECTARGRAHSPRESAHPVARPGRPHHLLGLAPRRPLCVCGHGPCTQDEGVEGDEGASASPQAPIYFFLAVIARILSRRTAARSNSSASAAACISSSIWRTTSSTSYSSAFSQTAISRAFSASFASVS